MNFKFNDEQVKFIQMVKEVSKKYVAPLAMETDKNATFPKEAIENLAKNSLMGIPFDNKFCGAWLDNLSYIAALE